jgi:hypothetical protein
MSADNGIYVAKFSDGYRVTEAQAIENIDYFPAGSKERKEQLLAYFGESTVFETQEEAFNYAHKLEANIAASDFPVLEYGVSYIGPYEDFWTDEDDFIYSVSGGSTEKDSNRMKNLFLLKFKDQNNRVWENYVIAEDMPEAIYKLRESGIFKDGDNGNDLLLESKLAGSFSYHAEDIFNAKASIALEPGLF